MIDRISNPATSTEPSNNTSSLLSLPREIRDEIYRHLLVGETSVKLPVTTSDPDLAYLRLLREVKLSSHLETSPQLVCRQIQSEYIEVFSKSASLRIVARVFGTETDLFRGVKRHLPASIRANIYKCSVFIAWKPRWGNDIQSTPTLLRNLIYLHEVLPGLKNLSVEHRYFDVHDLEEDIENKNLSLDSFYGMTDHPRLINTNLTLSATTTLLSQDEKHRLDVSGQSLSDLDYLLKVECYVIWQFTRCSEVNAWNGLFPRAATFFCCGEERDSLEKLEEVVTRKWNESSFQPFAVNQADHFAVELFE